MLKHQKQHSPVKDKLMEVIMLTRRPSVKCSTFVLLMELEVLPSTASCVPMEPSSTRTTSSVTGGSMLTVLNLLLLLRPRTPRLLLLETLLLRLLPLMLLTPTLLLLNMSQSHLMLPLRKNMNMKLLPEALLLIKEDFRNVP